MSPRTALLLEQLVSTRTMQRLQDNFAEALGISLCVYDLEGNVVTEESNLSRFWKFYVQDNPLVAPFCKKRDIEAGSKAIEKGEEVIFTCYNDTYTFAVPLYINGRGVGFFIGGRVRKGNPNLKQCHQEAERLMVDFDEFLESYLMLPLFGEEELKATAKLLRNVSTTIASLATTENQAKEARDESSYLKELLEKEMETREKALKQSEERYRNLVENALDIICTVSSEGVITSINSIAEQYFGYKKEEIIGRHFSTFIYPLDLPALKQTLYKLKEKCIPEIRNLEFRVNRQNSDIRHFSMNGKVYTDSSNHILHIDCVIRDITDQRRLEEEVVKTKNEYQYLIDTVPDGIYKTDMNGKFITMNKAGREMFKYAENEILNMDAKKLYVNPSEREPFLKELLGKGEVKNFIAHLKDKYGRDFYVETHATLARDHHGNPLYVEGVIRDITERLHLSALMEEHENGSLKSKKPRKEAVTAL